MANDIYTPRQIMAQLVTVLLPSTRIQTVNSQILIDDLTALQQNTGIWPIAVLEESKQTTARIAWQAWQTKLTLTCSYYDRWDQQQLTMAAVWENIDTDLRQMKANLENNPALIVSGTRYIENIVSTELSPYEAAVTPPNKTFPFPVIERMMTILLNLRPFTSTQ